MSHQISGHSPDHEQTAALYALGALERGRMAAFERHLENCPRCQSIVDQDSRTVASLSALAPEMEPPPGFKSRLLARVFLERDTARAQPAAGRGPRLRRLAARAAGLAALVCLVLAVGFIGGQQISLRQVLLSVPLQGDGSSQSAVIVRRSGEAEVALRGLAAPPAGQLYVAWLVGPDGRYVRAGTYDEGDGVFPLGQPVVGRTVVITLEPAPESASPTTRPLLSATVTQ